MSRAGRLALRAAAITGVVALACSPAAGSPQDADASEPTPPTIVGDSVDGMVPVELATVGMDPAQHSPVVLLREQVSGKIVPIWVGIPEAQAILTIMLGLEMPRPMTHDLLTTVIEELGATVEEVVVHEVQGTTYIGRIRLRVGGDAQIREIDSRPSDALAIAIRTDAPIRVAESLLADPPDFDFLAPEADEQVVRLLGATVVAPTAVLRTRYRLPNRPGLVVVGASGEAAEKGLRRGDLILEVGGSMPREPMDFLNAVRGARETVRVRYWRDGEEGEVELSPILTIPGLSPRRGPAPIQT
jgi:uncharacterized protein